MLLRGCQLRNCNYVVRSLDSLPFACPVSSLLYAERVLSQLGLVISTGRDTKINFGTTAVVQKTGTSVLTFHCSKGSCSFELKSASGLRVKLSNRPFLVID